MATGVLKTYTRAIESQAEQDKGLTTTNQGGLAYRVDHWTMLKRFLILGTEGSTYYESEQKRTDYNIKSVQACLQEDPIRVINTIIEVSKNGLAAKNDPAILALALAASFTSNDQRQQQAVRDYALKVALPQVCRISTHLFHFAEYVDKLRGWGSGLRKGIGAWYTGKSDMALANQVTKYVQRDGWSHADILRLTHPTPKNEIQNAIFKYVVDGELPSQFSEADAMQYLYAVEYVKQLTDPKVIARAIRESNLPREVVPTLALNSPEVWEALLYAGDGMPMTAMIRNLGNMSKVQLLAPLSDATRFVMDRLGNTDALAKARIHPLDVMKAKMTYQSGHGFRGSSSWPVNNQIVGALEDAFYGTFKNVEPTGKRGILALDVSGSMTWEDIGGINGFTPRLASAVMAMVTARTERDYEIVAFSAAPGASYYSARHSDGMFDPGITPNDSLDEVMRKVDNLPAFGTDCSLPMKHAMKHNRKADYFVVYTDSETGGVNPSSTLRDYRKKSGIHDAKLIVVGMLANRFSIADPTDPNMLDVVGFDSSAPQVMSMFIRGEI
jgi:60 kDa SS-A/Ro ribonucleoprotein